MTKNTNSNNRTITCFTVPPLAPVCRLNNSDGQEFINNRIEVKNGSSIAIFCEAKAIPPPIYSWTANVTYYTLTPKIIQIVSILTDVFVVITATNKMRPTGASEQSSSNKTTLTIRILSKYHFSVKHEQYHRVLTVMRFAKHAKIQNKDCFFETYTGI